MNTQLNTTSTALCVGCLSSERKLNLVTELEQKQMFCGFLETLEFSNQLIPLCYECEYRLNNAASFKKQVKKVCRLLTGYIKFNELPTFSTLGYSKTSVNEWEPTSNTDTLQQDTLVRKTNMKQKESDDSHNLDSDNEISYDNTESPDSDTLQDDTSDIKYFKEADVTSLRHKNGVNSPNLDKQVDTWEFKVENILEKAENLNYIKQEPIDENNCKEYRNLQMVLKSETKYEFSDSDDEPLKTKCTKTKKVKKEVKVQKRERPAGVVTGVWVQKKLQQLNVPSGQLEMVVLSWEEVELERQKSLNHTTFTRHEFRCASCIVGFNHRFKLESHMKKHLPEAGDLECSICKTRFKTQGALMCHRRRHRSRWRCSRCALLFSRAGTAADHHARAHGAPPPKHACHVCGHCEPSLGKLRIHLKNHAERQHCEQCGKSFRDKSSLRTHLYIHTNQKDFSCEVCDKKFRFKKALEIHRVTHQAPELLYCRDCDMNFKNRLSFYQHINYSKKHIHPDKVKYACEFCSRRFSKPVRLEEHRLSIHLKLAPHRCTVEGCTFASASRPALRNHVRMLHRNKRFERNHVCHTCGKAYTTKKILEGHIRSHTGERPFSCTKCPATFSHDAALYNHNKLVHKTPFVPRRKLNPPQEILPQNWGVVTTGVCDVTTGLPENSTHSVDSK